MSQAPRQELVKSIADLAGGGLTRRQIADTIGVSYTVVRRIMSERGIECPHAATQDHELTRDAIRSYAAKGLTQSQIARKLGVSRQRINQQCALHGIVCVNSRRRKP